MKVGTDGVLLGAWANTDKVARILDIGTGTGLIALMLAQRSAAAIDAIEIDENAFVQATENGRNSPWSDRLRFIHSSFAEFIEKSNGFYELVISNPPYHKETIESPHMGRRLARHASNLHYSEIIEKSSAIISQNGKIALVLPYNEESQAIKIAIQIKLHCSRVTRIIPAPGKNPSRSLIEFTKEKASYSESSIIIEEEGRHKYSFDYKELTREFYLNF
jgi:tRNA1Val (adenine37-N6)-methyltransferase